MSTHFSNQFVGVMSWFVNKWTQFCSISHSSSCEELTHWKRPWCWEGLGAGGEGDDGGWDGWMASPIWWTWVLVNSGSCWWTGRLGVLRLMGSQRVGHDWVTELNWIPFLDPFHLPLNSVYHFAENLAFVFIHQWYWSIVLFLFCSILIWLWYQNNASLIK